MISDGDLYQLAIFLGSCAMMMIVLYHFLDVNARDEEPSDTSKAATPAETAMESTASSTQNVPGVAGSPAATGKGK